MVIIDLSKSQFTEIMNNSPTVKDLIYIYGVLYDKSWGVHHKEIEEGGPNLTGKHWVWGAMKEIHRELMNRKVKNFNPDWPAENYCYDVRFIKDDGGLRVDRRTVDRDLRKYFCDDGPYSFDPSGYESLKNGEYRGVVSYYWTNEGYEYPNTDYIEAEIVELKVSTHDE